MKKKTLLIALLMTGSILSLFAQFNNALVLNGCTDYLEVPDNDVLDFDQGLSLEAWVYPNCADGNRVILSKQWCQGQYGYYLSVNNGRLFWSYSSNGFCTNSSTYQSVDALIPAQAFSHLAVVHTATSIDLFVNGEEVASEQNTGGLGSIASSNAPFRVGAYKNISGGISNYFSGLIDEIRVWNTALDETQINQRKDAPLNGNEANLALYFDMEDVGLGVSLSLSNQSTLGNTLDAAPAGFTAQSPYIIPHQAYDDIGIELNNEVVAGNEIITCNETIDLLLAPQEYKSIIWSTGATSPSLTVSATDFYWVQVETELCRFYRDTFIVEVGEVFVIDGEYELCEGSSITIVNETYSEAGVYFEDVPGPDGCDTVYIHDISLLPSIAETSLSIPACSQTSIIFDGQELLPGTTTPFVYTAANGCDSIVTVEVAALPTIETQLALQSCPGTPLEYEGVSLFPGTSTPFTYTTNEGCDSVVTVQVSNYPPVLGFLGPDINSCGARVTLNSLVDHTIWGDGTIGSVRQVDEAAIFTANYTDSLGCVQSDTIEVRFLSQKIFVPNAFSPNGDGVNDCFRSYAPGPATYLEYELQIFNRWGAIVYASTDADACWDGTFRGQALNSDIFVWKLRLISPDCNEAVTREGDVLLLR